MASTITTYHCLCTQLVLATPSPTSLSSFPKRQTDGSYICTLSPSEATLTPNTSILTSAVTIDDKTPVVLNLEDGFEKRYPVMCERCGVMFGYQLDWSQWDATANATTATKEGGGNGRRRDVVYVIPGGLVRTEDVGSGRKVGEREVEVRVGR